MKKIVLIKHSKGAIGLRLFGLGPNFLPCKGLFKLNNLLNNHTFWAKNRKLNELKRCLANSDVIVSIWLGREILGFGRALSDNVYRCVLWDIVIDQNYHGKGYGKKIVKSLLESKKIKKTQKVYLMTTNKKYFYSQVDFNEVDSQTLLVKEI